MEAITKTQAKRIAYFGARKMTDQGYSFETCGAGGIIRRADGYGYSVCLPAGGETGVSGNCTCKFFEENQAHGVCKHIYWAQWQADAAKAQAERDAEEDSYHLRYADTEGPEGCYAHPHVPGLGV